MFGEFNEATQLKTSSAKYSIEFNDLAVRQTLHITVCENVCGQTNVAIEVHDHYTTPPFFRHLLVYFLNVSMFGDFFTYEVLPFGIALSLIHI